jgi:hypothetical protein
LCRARAKQSKDKIQKKVLADPCLRQYNSGISLKMCTYKKLRENF